VTRGSDALAAPSDIESRALARIGAAPRVRLACQVRPTADISVLPLLGADAVAAESIARGGLEGSERLITILIVDLRGSTALSEAKLPYDLLYVLNQFFREMTKALDATNGHYAQFAGDGLLALYGLNTGRPADGAADAVRGAREMLARIDQLNSRLRGELTQAMRIGIAIDFGEAIVGTMGPPQSQITTAIGDMVNTCARLSDLTKEFDCPVIISERAAEAGGLAPAAHQLHQAPVRGRAQPARFYALQSLADLRPAQTSRGFEPATRNEI
jgi:adenylate cyclase